ncbi:MAG TPA: methyltransferase domain-containing protein [Spirochaetota bacterium]|nr:methyltransferase domain-containing protein [Spirochaetota bacterium]
MRHCEIVIQKVAYGGFGLGFLDRMAVFVPYAFPGDRIRAALTVEKKSHAFGEIAEIIDPSEMRTTPECPNYTRCGGCDYLAVSYEHELEIKRGILAESIERIGSFPRDTIPAIETISGPRLHYRSHATVKYDGGATGLYARGTSSLIAFPPEGCLLVSERIAAALREKVPGVADEFRIAEDAHGRILRSTEADRMVEDIVAGILYRRDISSFFQSNRFLRERMLGTVGEFAGLKKDERFIDIGCGVGFFTLDLARSGNPGTGVDRDRIAISSARENARANNIGSAAFLTADASSFPARGHAGDTVILDPPRAGISAAARGAISGLSPRRIIYVSCNPTTFARDIRDFAAAGYPLKKILFIDMFPATMHIEAIGLLERVI